jgi:malate dehydrogenase (quinone)
MFLKDMVVSCKWAMAEMYLIQKLLQSTKQKVYGKASVGAPSMSVPHIDSRMIDGRKALFFGPFAGFSTDF